MFWKTKNTMPITTIHTTVCTDVGNMRTNNEDAAKTFIPDDASLLSAKGILLLLADGMGGHNCGEVASAMVMEHFSNFYYQHKKNILASLKYAMAQVNKMIYGASVNDASRSGMGTTCTAVAVCGNRIFTAQVGDSRAYFFNEEKSTQLTKDQTLVQYKLDNKEITAEEAERHPDRNVLINAMGTKPEMMCDVKQAKETWSAESYLLLCSDGLYEYVKKEEMAELLKQENDIEKLAQTLINRAKERGGHDNITVVIATNGNKINGRKLKETLPG